MYDTLQERNQDKYIDCLAPESRMSSGLFREQVIRAGVGVVMIFQCIKRYSFCLRSMLSRNSSEDVTREFYSGLERTGRK